MRHLKFAFILISLFLCTSVFALPFNNQLSKEDIQKLNSGETVIRSIDYAKYMCLKTGVNTRCDELIKMVKDFGPKYLGEVILVKPYKGNEDLPDRLDVLLNNIDSYTDIPYYSEYADHWYKLYNDAELVNRTVSGNKAEIYCNLIMDNLGLVQEKIDVTKENDMLTYSAYNINPLRWDDKFQVLSPDKMRIAIVVFRYEDKWIIYGTGGVNAPHVPFLTDRIRIAFINRINAFCDYIFKKL